MVGSAVPGTTTAPGYIIIPVYELYQFASKIDFARNKLFCGETTVVIIISVTQA